MTIACKTIATFSPGQQEQESMEGLVWRIGEEGQNVREYLHLWTQHRIPPLGDSGV